MSLRTSLARSAAAVAVVAVLAGALGTPVAATKPTGGLPGPQVLVARFTDGPRGMVVVNRRPTDDALILRAAFIGLQPGRTYRLVLATSYCGETALEPIVVSRFSSIGESDEKYLVRNVTDLLPDGLDSRVSASLRKVRGGPAQCVDTSLYAYGPAAAGAAVSASPQVTFTFERVAWFSQRRTKGIVLVQGFDETVRISATLVALRPGVRHKLVGSPLACGDPHTAPDTRYRTRATRWVDREVEGTSPITAFTARVFRGQGYATETGCGRLVPVLVP